MALPNPRALCIENTVLKIKTNVLSLSLFYRPKKRTISKETKEGIILFITCSCKFNLYYNLQSYVFYQKSFCNIWCSVWFYLGCFTCFVGMLILRQACLIKLKTKLCRVEQFRAISLSLTDGANSFIEKDEKEREWVKVWNI